MLLPKHQHPHGRLFAVPVRGVWHRFGFWLMALVAGWLLLLGQVKPQLMAPARIEIVDSVAPLIDMLSRPGDLAQDIHQAWRDWFALQDEVQQLRAENARLKAWEQTGATLLTENRALKDILKFHPEPIPSSLTARVIATTGAPYGASMIVTAGKREGVKKNMAAMSGDGLVGRVIEVGEWSSRVLLVTDPESRIPVMLQENGAQAILAGDGTGQLQLRFLPADTPISAGSRFVTSGQGGVLPPQLPAGVAQQDGDGALHIVPAADLSRTNYVRLIDFSLAGGPANSLGAGLDSAQPR